MPRIFTNTFADLVTGHVTARPLHLVSQRCRQTHRRLCFRNSAIMASSDDERNIVIAMDGSKNSDEAFHWYMDNVHRKSDHVVLVHCPEYHTIIQSPMVMADVTVLTDLYKDEERKVKEFLEFLGQKLKDCGIGGKVKSVGGSPGEVICQVATDVNATMIVTGTRGMGQLRRTFMGSISDYIVHHSHVPVVVCRTKGAHHEHGQQVQK